MAFTTHAADTVFLQTFSSLSPIFTRGIISNNHPKIWDVLAQKPLCLISTNNSPSGAHVVAERLWAKMKCVVVALFPSRSGKNARPSYRPWPVICTHAASNLLFHAHACLTGSLLRSVTGRRRENTSHLVVTFWLAVVFVAGRLTSPFHMQRFWLSSCFNSVWLLTVLICVGRDRNRSFDFDLFPLYFLSFFPPNGGPVSMFGFLLCFLPCTPSTLHSGEDTSL